MIAESTIYFSSSTKIFTSEKLTPMNEPIIYNCRKLRRNEVILSYLSSDSIIRIKREERPRFVKIFDMDKLHHPFRDFDFSDADEDDDIFLDASQIANASVQSSY